MLKKNPELLEEFMDKAADLLHDKNQAVALSGVTLMLQICQMQPQAIERYRQHVPKLCTMLRSLLQVRSQVVSLYSHQHGHQQGQSRLHLGQGRGGSSRLCRLLVAAIGCFLFGALVQGRLNFCSTRAFTLLVTPICCAFRVGSLLSMMLVA